MITFTYSVLGVMSGTSLDGIDLVWVSFEKSTDWSYKIRAASTIAYPLEWTRKLQNADKNNALEIKLLNRDYTRYLALTINRFKQNYKITHLDAICSHGHTIFHQPETKYTLQIGNLPELAKITNERVICDFRVQDVALGGQGAPLVPVGDQLLFPKYQYCINLGGFANISMGKDKKRSAYDICAVNVVLNLLAQQLGHPFDHSGDLARSGVVQTDLLKKLNELSFYTQKPPKSLGIEWVRQYIHPILQVFRDCRTIDVLRTFTHHIADQIASPLADTTRHTALVTGGGAFNTFLIEEIQRRTKTNILIPDSDTVEYKEALIFGLLGVLKLRNEVNCLQSVTGAQKDHSSGVIWLP